MNFDDNAPKIIEKCAEALGKSEKGLDTLAYLGMWLEDAGASLDAENQLNVYVLLSAVWGAYPETALRAMMNVLANAGPRELEIKKAMSVAIDSVIDLGNGRN